ncbi:hypothetical protein [Haloarcula marina]|uniref:hypothetical protein n=1 Tax=Haloarcula marina TaxID=2961574 RepID=UPI0020B6EFD8|nr:hypothetical protein [Halomicroarcula marina]
MVSAEELQERLRPAVRDYAETVQSKAEDNDIYPYKEIACLDEDGDIEVIEISVPTDGVQYLIDPDTVTHFDNCAEWLAGSEDELDLTHAHAESTYESWLRNFANTVFNYVGDYSFDEQAYQAAFRDIIGPDFNDSLFFDVLIPLPGLSRNSEPVSFTPQSPEYQEEQYLYTVSSDFDIDLIDAPEMAAIHNKSLEGHISEPTKLGWKGRLRFTIEIEDRSRDLLVVHDLAEQAAEISVDIGRKVVNGLRLSEPHEDGLWFGPIFLLQDNWLTYREGVEGVERIRIHPDSDIEYRHVLRFTLDEIGARSFSDVFWKEQADLLTSDTFDGPIRRYNRTYLPGHAEDHILDCHIALESLLMKGAKGGTSFRMPIAAAILLRDRVGDPIEVYYFFDVLREVRNKIVHEDKTVEDVAASNLNELPNYLLEETDAGERLERFQFIKHTREYLSLMIKEYYRIEQEHGLNIHEANQELVEEMILSVSEEDEPVDAIFEQ